MNFSNLSFSAEPAVWVGVVEAAIVLAVAFGAPITSDQKEAIIAFTSAILAIVGGVVVRQQVTPNAKVPVPLPPPAPLIITSTSGTAAAATITNTPPPTVSGPS